jgi:hypothetical protein
MTNTIRRLILRANALYIGGAALAGLVFDVRGILFGVGPQGRILASAPHAAIGFIEAHGLALILSVLLWRAAPTRSWLLTAIAVEVLLGTANLVFWEMFVASDALLLGYVTTALHWTFALAQFIAATSLVDHQSSRALRRTWLPTVPGIVSASSPNRASGANNSQVARSRK